MLVAKRIVFLTWTCVISHICNNLHGRQDCCLVDKANAVDNVCINNALYQVKHAIFIGKTSSGKASTQSPKARKKEGPKSVANLLSRSISANMLSSISMIQASNSYNIHQSFRVPVQMFAESVPSSQRYIIQAWMLYIYNCTHIIRLSWMNISSDIVKT